MFRLPLSDTEAGSNSATSISYENNIAQHFNLSSEELNYDSDKNQSLLPIPSSKYITEAQLKDVRKQFPKIHYRCYI